MGSKNHKNKRNIKREIDEEIADMQFERSRDSMQFKVNFKFKNKKQKDMYNTILANRITFVRGVAGTGKTMVALMTALEVIKSPDININHIILTKPIIETSSTSIGALPGTVDEKIFSHYTHFYDNLEKMIGHQPTKYLKESGIIKESILNFMRGNTFGKWDSEGNPLGAFCVLDEAQNSTPGQMKTFISRMGEQSKLIIMGDIDQIDIRLKNGEMNGLSDAIDRLVGMDGIGFVEFTEDDIVRDPFLIEIMKRYK